MWQILVKLFLGVLLITLPLHSMDYVRGVLHTTADNTPENVLTLLHNKYLYLGVAGSIAATYGILKKKETIAEYFYPARRFERLKRTLPGRMRELVLCLNDQPKTTKDYSKSEIKARVTPLGYTLFNDTLDLFFNALQHDSIFTKQDLWADGDLPKTFVDNITDFSRDVVWLKAEDIIGETKKQTDVRFNPFIQKIITPPGAVTVPMGDLHGDVHSLIALLERDREAGHLDGAYRIKDSNRFYIFLGDYVDRGAYGAEVIALACYFKCMNFSNVVMCRGNHEDGDINKKYGFYEELQNKYEASVEASFIEKIRQKLCLLCGGKKTIGQSELLLRKILKFYECMPLEVFRGTVEKEVETQEGEKKLVNYDLLLHGGPEIGISAHPLWHVEGNIAYSRVKEVDREGELKKLCNNPAILEMFKKFIFPKDDEAEFTAGSLEDYILNNDGMLDPEEYWIKFKPLAIRMPHPNTKKRRQGKLATIGTLWNDFRVQNDKEFRDAWQGMHSSDKKRFAFVTDGLRGTSLGETFTKALLAHFSDEFNRVRMIQRGHQHGVEDMMDSILNKDGKGHEKNIGLSKLWQVEKSRIDDSEKGKEKVSDNDGSASAFDAVWDGLVCTYNVAPCTPYSDAYEFKFATVGELKTAPQFEDWRLTVDRLPIME